MVPVEELEEIGPRRRRLQPILTTAFIVALVAALAYGFLRAPDEAGRGRRLPAFDMPLLAGADRLGTDGRVTNDDLAGRPVVLNLWASWCLPCREEMPLFQRAADEYADQGLVVLAVDVRDVEADARAFIDELGLSFPIARDEGNALADSLKVFGLPQTFFIGRDGSFVAVASGSRLSPGAGGQVLGAIDAETLDARIDELLRGG